MRLAGSELGGALLELWASQLVHAGATEYEAWRQVYSVYVLAVHRRKEDVLWRKIVENLPPCLQYREDGRPAEQLILKGWFMKREQEIRAAIQELRASYGREMYVRQPQVHFVEVEAPMSYTMEAGSVYKLARSLRHSDVFALPPGVFEPEVVEVDAEVAAQMEYAGVLVLLDNQVVAVFTHPEDTTFVLGMPVDPTATPDQPASEQVLEAEVTEAVDEAPPEEPSTAPAEEGLPTPTPEQMAEWGYEEDAACECGYYIRDHGFDGEALVCPATT